VSFRLLVVLLISFGTTTGGQAQVTFTPLGDLPGGSFLSQAIGVSGNGQVAFGHSWSTAAGYEAFRWTSGNGMVGLGNFSSGPQTGYESRPYASSFDGSVLVGSGSTTSERAFRWTSATGMVDLGNLPTGTTWSRAYSTSNDGNIIVGYSETTAGIPVAFRWTSTNGMTSLGYLPGGDRSLARGVSADGSVIVGGSATLGGGGGYRAFRWDETNGMTNLGVLPGQGTSIAQAISANGQVIVGHSGSGPFGGSYLGFRWSSTAGMQPLGDLPGGANLSTAMAVSADGTRIVGYSDSTLGWEPFLWTEAEGMRSLRNVLLDAGVDLTGWTIGNGAQPGVYIGISHDGNTIVNHGSGPRGMEAYIINFTAAVPEPATYALIAVVAGVAGPFAYRHARKVRRRPRSAR
jgi:probable HAF family extracellular repeat protein